MVEGLGMATTLYSLQARTNRDGGFLILDGVRPTIKIGSQLCKGIALAALMGRPFRIYQAIPFKLVDPGTSKQLSITGHSPIELLVTDPREGVLDMILLRGKMFLRCQAQDTCGALRSWMISMAQPM